MTGKRVTVASIARLEAEGMTPAEIAEDGYAVLTLAEVHAALAFYHANREYVDSCVAVEAELGRRLAAEHWPHSLARKKLGERPPPDESDYRPCFPHERDSEMGLALYLDEDSNARHLVQVLGRLDVDVVVPSQLGMLGRADEDQLEFAFEQSRVLVSGNIRPPPSRRGREP